MGACIEQLNSSESCPYDVASTMEHARQDFINGGSQVLVFNGQYSAPSSYNQDVPAKKNWKLCIENLPGKGFVFKDRRHWHGCQGQSSTNGYSGARRLPRSTDYHIVRSNFAPCHLSLNSYLRFISHCTRPAGIGGPYSCQTRKSALTRAMSRLSWHFISFSLRLVPDLSAQAILPLVEKGTGTRYEETCTRMKFGLIAQIWKRARASITWAAGTVDPTEEKVSYLDPDFQKRSLMKEVMSVKDLCPSLMHSREEYPWFQVRLSVSLLR